MIALSVDVDTHDGMRVGVPRLLDAFKAHGVRATFFLSLGPDRSGRAMIQVALNPRFLLKMVGTGAPSLYGWRTILSGTVLPERPIATAFPEIVRRIEDEGHEAAIHAWDHRSWQDDLPRFKTHRIEAHFNRALHAFRNLTGRDPWGIRAPAWMTTPESLLLQDRLPLRYASDLRASPACFLTTPLGQPRLPRRRIEIERLEDGQNVLFHRQPAKDRRLLRQVADPLPRPDVHRIVGDVFPVENDAS